MSSTRPPRPAQPDTYMITLAGAGSLLCRTGRGGGRGRGVDVWRSDSRSTVGRGRGGGEGGGELRRRSSSSSGRQPGLLTDLTRGQRGRRPLGSSKTPSSSLTAASPHQAEQQPSAQLPFQQCGRVILVSQLRTRARHNSVNTLPLCLQDDTITSCVGVVSGRVSGHTRL